MYAVDSLRQLVSKLLARAELAYFTHQEEALRPFCFILRYVPVAGSDALGSVESYNYAGDMPMHIIHRSFMFSQGIPQCYPYALSTCFCPTQVL